MSSFANLWNADRRAVQEVENDIDEELAFHLQLQTEENIAAGMSPADARASAQKRFGSVQKYAAQAWRIDMAHQFTLQRIAIIGLVVLAAICGWLWLQISHLNGQNSQLLQLVQQAAAQDKPVTESSFPIDMSPEEIREFAK